MTNPFAVIILAAGKGTRMESDLPKVLHEINGVPMVSHVINTSKGIGALKIITVIGYRSDMIKNILGNSNTHFVIQEKQLGTGHAVLQCKDELSTFDGNVIVLSGDVPLISDSTLTKLLSNHDKSNNTATVLTAEVDDPKGYGRVVRNTENSLEKIVEHKDATEDEQKISEINAGIYVFNCKTLFECLPNIKNNNKQGEYYLPDVLTMIIENKLKVGVEKTKNISEIQGVNTIEQLEQLNSSYNNSMI